MIAEKDGVAAALINDLIDFVLGELVAETLLLQNGSDALVALTVRFEVDEA